MTHWMTSSEISARYIAGEQKLLDYARRGNMPMFRQDDGSILFDGAHAASLFRPRGPSLALTAPADGKPNMGLLGVSRLGERAAPRTLETGDATEEPVPQSQSRHPVRLPTRAEAPRVLARKAG